MRRLGIVLAVSFVLLSVSLAGCISSEEKNKPPIAVFEVSANTINDGDNITFDASGSRDSDGEIERFQWNFGDGRTDQGVEVTHKFNGGGDFNVTLTVTDNDGDKDVATIDIHVNKYPEADGGPSKGVATIYDPVVFDASFSNDPDGSIIEYSWDFGDGGKKVTTSKTLEHSYDAVGNFTVTLTVKDDDGAVDKTSSKVTICLKKFQILWSEAYERDLVGRINGHTEEPSNDTNETRETQTNKTIRMESTNLTRIIFELNWSDDIPIVRANNDNFRFIVTDPEGNTMQGESMTPGIKLTFDLGSAPQNTTMDAKNIQDVKNSIGNAYEKKNGVGNWKASVICLDAGDLVWVDNELFEDLDTGNDWTISVNGYTFEYTVVDLGTGP